MNAYDYLLKYFQGIADGLSSDQSASRAFPNSADAGMTREDLLIDFLKKHLPARCGVIKGGYVLDSDGAFSRQIDILVTNDLCLQFRHFHDVAGKAFSAIEGCYCATSVKTTLNGKELRDSMDGFASIPRMPELSINPFILNAKKWLDQLPYRVIFAFEGMRWQNVIEHINAYWHENRTLGHRILPHLIVVNNDYGLVRTIDDSFRSQDDKPIPANTFMPLQLKSVRITGAICLMRLLIDIQKCSQVGSSVLFDFEKYNTGISKYIRSMSGASNGQSPSVGINKLADGPANVPQEPIEDA